MAVSGGADSTALLLALHDLESDVVAAHVNHHLRGAESDADETFVRDLCAVLGVPLRVGEGSLDPGRVRARGVEAAAREVRYARLLALRDEEGAAWVATAHQKNDQAETILMRLLTGSGLAGLRGIHPVRADGFIRPLLEVTRADVDAYLAERNVTPRIDRSNDDPRFLRNRVRVFLRHVDAVENLARIAAQARAQWPAVERAIDEADRACVEAHDDRTVFRAWPDDEWLRGALLQRHIRRLDPQARDFDAGRLASQVEAITRVSVTKNLELVRKATLLVLRKRLEAAPDFEVELTDGTAFIPAAGVTMHALDAARASARRRNDEDDASGAGDVRAPFRQLIELPEGADLTFTVRNRRPGDRFQPLGMDRPKKLKDFFIDRKIDADVRDRLPLLVWNGEIVWIPGVEVSERFKVRGAGGLLCEVWTDERHDQSGLQR